jgi:DNA-binding CsgD family transcriptional regulator
MLHVSVVTNFRRRDLDAAFALVAEAAAGTAAQPFTTEFVDALLRLVPADRGGYFEYDDGGTVNPHGTTLLVDRPSLPPGHLDEVPWNDCDVAPSWPLQNGLIAPLNRPVFFSDFVGEREKHRNAWYCEVMRPGGVEHECKFVLSYACNGAGWESARGFFFVRERGRRDFDERDRDLLTLLQPHLTVIRARWGRPPRVQGLTPREHDVLILIRDGLTNKEVAQQLVVSATTVRTHLEHIFEKLDVHTRSAAARALDRR